MYVHIYIYIYIYTYTYVAIVLGRRALLGDQLRHGELLFRRAGLLHSTLLYYCLLYFINYTNVYYTLYFSIAYTTFY